MTRNVSYAWGNFGSLCMQFSARFCKQVSVNIFARTESNIFLNSEVDVLLDVNLQQLVLQPESAEQNKSYYIKQL